MQAGSQEQMQFATLGWRFAATVIDTVVLFFCLVALLGVGAALGAVQLPDPNTTNPFDVEAAQATMPSWIYFGTYGLLFFYYSVLEALTGASLGKLALGMRVRMDDGRPATLTAAIVRNLIRIPEALLWYIPSAVSCLLSSRGKRLGDFAAGTVVVRRTVAAPKFGMPPAVSEGEPVPSGPPRAQSAAWPSPETAATDEVALGDALGRLKASVLAARGAHDAFLRFSEIELSRRPEEMAGEDQEAYSPEYVAAWYSLSDAVHDMSRAREVAMAASTRAGTTLDSALATQPDLAYILRQLAPYLAPEAADYLHEAYMQVVRGQPRG